jgi:muramoyltetrapeptide carboxypeptidase
MVTPSEPWPQPRLPSCLRPGATIGLVGVCGPLPANRPGRLQRARIELHRLGFSTVVSNACVDERVWADDAWSVRIAEALTETIEDPAVDGVMSLVGGSKCFRVVRHLDMCRLGDTGKPLVGFSDFSALLLPLSLETGLVTFYGPAVMPQFGEFDGVDDFTRTSFELITGGYTAPLRMPCATYRIIEYLEWDRGDSRPRKRIRGERRPVVHGRASGRLVPTNLTVLARLLLEGAVDPGVLEGTIVLLDVSDSSNLTRFFNELAALRAMGVFGHCAGVVFGSMVQVLMKDWKDDALISGIRACVGTRVPCAGGLEFGHCDPVLTLPVGIPAQLCVRQRSVELTLLEGSVQGS